MKISLLTSEKQSFKAATVNINAFSDTHGELLSANKALEEMRNRQQDIFCRNEQGKTNVLAICGDWFMDGGRTGYKTSPKTPLAMFQAQMLNGLISNVKDIAANTTALFTPGNHEFDGGVQLLDKVLSTLEADVLMTNLDIPNSSGFSQSILNDKIINEKIIEVDDDKNPELKHKVLFLGVVPVNLSMYQKNLNGVRLINNSSKPQKYVEKDDYKETLEDCKARIKRFKQENKNGIVVFMSHTGVEFSDNLAKESTVDIIFDAHEHKDDIRIVNSTPIVPLSQNFKKIVNARIDIDDNGEIKNIKLKDFNPLTNRRKGPLFKSYCKMFRHDIRKQYSVKAADSGISVLDTQNIRSGNSFLANFVTDSVLEELQKQDSSIDFFALNSSAIRHPLKISDKPSITPFDVMNVLSGIRDEEGKIMTTEVTGRQLAYLVADNFLFNKEAPQKNPLIQYAGLSIDRTSILKAFGKGEKAEDLTKYIIDTKTQKPVEPDKKYKIANVEKYFNKSQNTEIKALKEQSEYTGDVVQNLFKQHFSQSRIPLFAQCDVRIK